MSWLGQGLEHGSMFWVVVCAVGYSDLVWTGVRLKSQNLDQFVSGRFRKVFDELG